MKSNYKKVVELSGKMYSVKYKYPEFFCNAMETMNAIAKRTLFIMYPFHAGRATSAFSVMESRIRDAFREGKTDVAKIMFFQMLRAKRKARERGYKV